MISAIGIEKKSENEIIKYSISDIILILKAHPK